MHEFATASYVFGLFGSRVIDVREACGVQTVREVSVHRKEVDYALTLLTLGLYLPQHVRLVCEAKP